MTTKSRSGSPWGLLAVLGILCVVALSACGFAGLASAKSTPSPSLSPQESALKFAECMRANGVPNFPDPTVSSGGGININAGSGIDPNSPAFQKAQQACSKYLQGNLSNNGQPDPAAQAKGLKFAQCMRAHGVPNFPDPSSSGGIDINGASGIDPNSPTFQKAQQTCQSILGAPAGSTTTTGGGGQ